MRPLPTVILRHRAPAGTHYDWLLADPRNPAGPLWCARVALHPRGWVAAGAWLLEPIAPHRRAYLTYQGPLSRGRGTVQRVARGWFRPRLWTARRRVLDLHLGDRDFSVELRRLPAGPGPERWRARVLPRSPQP